nr:PREDICTED: uncharacterized protein LOC107770776 [Nicotiana tabacum]
MDPQPYEQQQHTIPPKPPDIDQSMIKSSFKDMLTTSNPLLFTNIENHQDIDLLMMDSEDQVVDQSILTTSKGIKFITLSDEEKVRIYEPWKNSIIVKLVGKRMLHHYLKRKIQELWKPTEDFQLIDLGVDYYIIKFKKKENMDKVMHQGPWFINGHFLSITGWKPNFVSTQEKVTNSAVWIRLPQLPTEFYDGKILEKIVNAIGRLLKIDVCTSTSLRGHYERLCVKLPLKAPVQPFIYVDHHKQAIHYEGENFLCENCGQLGYIAQKCSFIIQKNRDRNNEDTSKELSTITNDGKKEQWTTISFSKGGHC